MQHPRKWPQAQRKFVTTGPQQASQETCFGTKVRKSISEVSIYIFAPLSLDWLMSQHADPPPHRIHASPSQCNQPFFLLSQQYSQPWVTCIATTGDEQKILYDKARGVVLFISWRKTNLQGTFAGFEHS